jgi:hypothetical protein
MMRPTDTLADLERRRADVAARADELTDMADRYPSREIIDERDRLCRLVDCYDRCIATLSKPRRSRR